MSKKEKKYSDESNDNDVEFKRKTWNGYYQRKTKTKKEKSIAEERKEKNRLKKDFEQF